MGRCPPTRPISRCCRRTRSVSPSGMTSVCALLEKADALLSQVQPAAAAARSAARAGGDADDSSDAALKEARALYDEALKKAPLEVTALANRAAC